MLLAGGNQSLVERDELRIPAKGCRQRGSIERAAQAFAPALDVANTDLIATVVVIRRKAGERRGLFAADLSDLRHAHQDGDSRRQSGTADAMDQLEPFGEVAIPADRCDQSL